MPTIDIPFHATLDELIEWVGEWVHFDCVTLIAVRFPPITFSTIERQDIRTTFVDPTVRNVSFVTKSLDLSVKYQSDFDDKYGEQLILRVGRCSTEGLGESWLSCRTDNAEALKTWRRIAKDLKAKTSAGVTATNRESGISAFYRSHRYSPGAKELEDRGVQILPIQGAKGPTIRLGHGNDPEAK